MQQTLYALLDMEFRADSLMKTERAWLDFKQALRQLHDALEADLRDLDDEINPIEGFRLHDALAADIAFAARVWTHA